MPLYDFSCGEHLFEAFSSFSQDEMKCRFCDRTAKRDIVSSMQRGLPPKYERTWAQGFTPTTIHVNSKGEVSFPMHEHAPVPEGYVKKELRTPAEIRKFEKQMGESERRKYSEHKSREHEIMMAKQREYRKTMRQALETGSVMLRDRDGNPHRVDFSEADKDFARFCMDRHDARNYMDHHFDPGFYLEAFSNDASNREGYSDRLTGWKRRK